MACLHFSKTCVKWPLSKRLKIGFQDQLSLNAGQNAGQKYCRMLQGEHSAILSTVIRLPFVIKIFVLSIFEWLFYTSFTVYELVIISQPSGAISLFIQIHCVDEIQYSKTCLKRPLKKNTKNGFQY